MREEATPPDASSFCFSVIRPLRDVGCNARVVGRLLLAAAVLAPLGLSGCGPGSVAALQEPSHKAYSFDVAADYRTVYERIVRRARRRYVFTGVPTHQPGLSANLSPEKQSGTVTLWDSGGIGIRYHLSAEIQAIGPARTRVDLYAAGKSDRREARLWAAWADTPLEE